MGNSGNPCGAVLIWDGTSPKTITAYAGSAISGGNLCWISGGTDVVSSGANSFVTSDLVATLGASGGMFTGIALHNAASGAPVTLATEGTFICESAGNVVAGFGIETIGVNCVMPLQLGSVFYKIGRALTSCGSEGYALVKISA